MAIYRIYKIEISPYLRQDGFRLVKSYGCNGVNHVISYAHIACDSYGMHAQSGKQDVKPIKNIGSCNHDKECMNLGEFLI